MAPRLGVVFWRLVRLGSFLACWRQEAPKAPSESPFVANYRLISISSVLSKVFERLVSVRHGRLVERSGVLPTTQFAYRKCLDTCDAILCVSHTLQSALESGQVARIVQNEWVKHHGIIMARYWYSCTVLSVFHSEKLADRLCWWLNFDGCCAIPRR